MSKYFKTGKDGMVIEPELLGYLHEEQRQKLEDVMDDVEVLRGAADEYFKLEQMDRETLDT